MFNIEYVKNLQWEDADHTFFSCVIKYTQFEEEHPSGVNGVDTTQHIKEIWEKANAGEYGPIVEYVAPPEPPEIEADAPQPTVIGAQEL
jgi:hypothetical protein